MAKDTTNTQDTPESRFKPLTKGDVTRTPGTASDNVQMRAEGWTEAAAEEKPATPKPRPPRKAAAKRTSTAKASEPAKADDAPATS